MGDAPRLLLQPTFLLYVTLGLAIANLWRRRKESRGRLLWVTVPYLLLSLVCTRAAGTLAHRALEWPYPPSDEAPGDAQAIVVLSGYVQARTACAPSPSWAPIPCTAACTRRGCIGRRKAARSW